MVSGAWKGVRVSGEFVNVCLNSKLNLSIYRLELPRTRGVILEYAGRTHVRSAYLVTLGVRMRHGLRLRAS